MTRRAVLWRTGSGPADKPIVRQVTTFASISVITTVLDFTLFNLLIWSGLHPVAANSISYSVGIVTSYVLNKRLTFRGGGRDRASHELGLFVLINIVGLGLNNAAVAAATEALRESALILNVVKLLAGVVTWGAKFLTFKHWVYPADGGSPNVHKRTERPLQVDVD